MKVVNRGYISIKAKQAFIDWANEHADEDLFFESDESVVYLIEDDFYEDEPILKKNFKKIMLNELEAVTASDQTYPEVNLETFLEWFEYEMGSTVLDCESNGIGSN